MHPARAAAIALAAMAAGCARACAPAPDPCDVLPAAYEALERGDLPTAQRLADQAAACTDRIRIWEICVLKAEILMKQRKAREALDLLEAAPEPPGVPDPVRVRALMTTGYAQCYLDRAVKGSKAGRDRLQGAEKLADALSPAGVELKGEVWLRLGTCFSFQDNEHATAELMFRKTLELGREAHLPRIEADAAGALARLRLLESRYDDAADWLEESKRLFEDFDPGAVEVMKVLTNLGWCYTELGDTERAMPLLRDANERAVKYGYREEEYLTHAHLGSCHLRLGELRRAREKYEEALPIVRSLKFKDDEREILELIQTVALKDGDTATAEKYGREVKKLDEGGAAAPASLVEAELALLRKDFEGAEKLYRRVLAEATTAGPRWRARAGLARMYVAAARTADAEAAFREALGAIESMRRELQQDTFDFLLYSSLTDFHGAYAAFLVDQKRPAEALAVVEHARGRVLWERLQARTDTGPATARFEGVARARHAVLLSYWVGERSFVWVVTDKTTRVHELPGGRALRAQAKRYRDLMQAAEDPLESDEGVRLFETLVGPVSDAIPKGANVVIVPDGPLHALAFDALVVPSTPPHYWVEDVVTMRTPSLALLAARPTGRPRTDQDLLLIGDPARVSDAFQPLPNAGREMDAVLRRFPPASSVVVRGERATPSAYRSARPARFRAIHFAAHATSNRDRPLESAVVLSREGLDYKLYARDVLDVPLAAEVVTVSACESAGARAYGGEGLVGFAWAFLRAGARNVVAGLWEVEDATTAQLMDQFYQARSSEVSEAAALRAAKLGFVRSEGRARRKPYYWGPFVTYVQ